MREDYGWIHNTVIDHINRNKDGHNINYEIICQKPLHEGILYEAWDLEKRIAVKLRYTVNINDKHELLVLLHIFEEVDVEIIQEYPNTYFLIDWIKCHYQIWNNRL